MITNKQQLQEYLDADAKHFTNQRQNWKTTKYNIFSNPISDNKYIWKYIVALRNTELCINSTNIIRHSFFSFLLAMAFMKIKLQNWISDSTKYMWKRSHNISLGLDSN